jgi:hypothetical protein
MRFRTALLFALVAVSAATPRPARAQKVIDVTVDMLDRFFKAYDTEKSETANVAPQLADVDQKINKFEQCKKDWEAAGAASGSKLGGFAARMAIRAKCGSSDADGFRKDRQKIMDGPENAAATAGGFKLGDYRDLRGRLLAFASGCGEDGFSKAGLDLLKSRQKQLASLFGVSMTVAQSGSGRGMRGPAVWNTDYAWLWISQLFAVQYLSGATMFEKDYKPGEWTRWQISTADNADETQTTERAFLGRTSEKGEWWRLKTINNYKDGDKATADTVVLETLFKPDSTNEYVQQLVRMRGRLPGSTEAQEMMVPQQWAMWNMMGAFPYKPTKESIDGATIGVEDVKTPAGSFKAKHVRFGQGGGTMDWWLDDSAVGGWVKFAAIGDDKQAKYTMELIGRGTGAKSELGVTFTPLVVAPPPAVTQPAAKTEAKPATKTAAPAKKPGAKP